MPSDHQTPIADMLKTPPQLPENEARIGVVTDGQDVGATATVNVDVGQPGGWRWLLDASYWKQKGYQVGTWLKWTK